MYDTHIALVDYVYVIGSVTDVLKTLIKIENSNLQIESVCEQRHLKVFFENSPSFCCPIR